MRLKSVFFLLYFCIASCAFAAGLERVEHETKPKVSLEEIIPSSGLLLSNLALEPEEEPQDSRTFVPILLNIARFPDKVANIITDFIADSYPDLSNLIHTLPQEIELRTRQYLGQMLMIGFEGTNPEDKGIKAVAANLKAGNIGGVIFYQHNIQGPKQLNTLMASFRSVDSELAPLFALDQEGGLVQRLRKRNGFSDYPKAKEMSADKTPQEAKEIYSEMASELAKFGFNLNLGCVLDMDPVSGLPSPAIGKYGRSFGSTAAKVIPYAIAFHTAHAEHKALVADKHFPGHGRTKGDTHNEFVDITETYTFEELEPYKEMINNGQSHIIMTAHLVHRNIDSLYPATLSPRFINGLLRKRLNFNGIVITDDLQMRAIRDHYNFKDIVLKSILAGNDILLFSNNSGAKDPEIVIKVNKVVLEAIQTGEIAIEMLGQAYKRIVGLKARLAKS